ncbi:MAG: BadF/BadG/BcrA/BcrD ATPase family protein [Sumerlaeia bacterium]
MPATRYVLGVDGGGTKTVGAIMNGDGQMLAREVFPSSNPHSNDRAAVADVLQTLVSSLCERARITPADIDAVCMGLAGCDSPKEREMITGLVAPALDPRTRLLIVNDAVVAMVAVLGELHGILVIAGTGSICLGHHRATGRTTRAGGWGHLLSDEGSGYLIGLGALQAVMRAFDGRGESTSLTARVFDRLECKEARDIITWTYRDAAFKTRIAALSPLVMEEDEKGDAVAGAILDTEAAKLAECVESVHRRMFGAEAPEDEGSDSPVKIGLWGGNLVHGKRYRERFVKLLADSALPVVPVVDQQAEAVLGACRHAINSMAEVEE